MRQGQMLTSPWPVKPTSCLLLLLSPFLFAHLCNGCVQPVGIDDASPHALSSSALSGLPVGGITSSYINLLVPRISASETPIQFHQVFVGSLLVYSAQAAFTPRALDPWARHDVSEARRRCAPEPGVNATAFELHRRVTHAYALINMASAVSVFRPVVPQVNALAVSQGLDPTLCTRQPAACESIDTPWGLAHAIVKEINLWQSNDGFNADGTYRRKFNPRPFEDWRDRPYHPQSAPWVRGNLNRWSPLVEVVAATGMSLYQRHVTPHIGETGKSMYIGDEEICRRSNVKFEGYNLEEELQAALKRTAELDDKKKAEVELFDNKIGSLFPLQGQFFSRLGENLDSFEYWRVDYAVNTALYEGLMLVWRIKVRNDFVRPTTVAEVLGNGRMATTYAGPNAGIQNIPIDQWEPFIRTMPYEVHNAFLKSRGNDTDLTGVLGGPLVFNFAAGSSRVEKGLPAKNISLSYASWDEVSEACKESRLDGGMHFRAAVPAGAEACKGLGYSVVEAVAKLVNGEKPTFVTELNSDRPSQTRCGEDGWGGKGKKGSKYRQH